MLTMKRSSLKISFICALAGWSILTAGCMKEPAGPAANYRTRRRILLENRRRCHLCYHGCLRKRKVLIDRDYYLDGHGEYFRTRGTSTVADDLLHGDAYRDGNYNPSGYAGSFDRMFKNLYGGVNRANYVIDNVTKMLPNATATSLPNLERIIGEARLLRGMVYFRLISMWGHVPYIGSTVYSNSEVATISRTPIAQVKDSIMADFTYAFEKLPVKAPEIGRASKATALAFRGKLQLYTEPAGTISAGRAGRICGR